MQKIIFLIFISVSLKLIAVENALLNAQLINAIENSNLASSGLLIKAGANVNVKDQGHSALEIATIMGNIKVASLLIANNANIDATSSPHGWTALMIASALGKKEFVHLLIENGADVNYTTDDRDTPLNEAAIKGNADIVSLLIKKGARIHYKTDMGLTPLMNAAKNGHEEAVKIIVEAYQKNGKYLSDISKAASIAKKYGHKEIAEFLEKQQPK